MTRNAKPIDDLEGTHLFQEEGVADHEGTEALQEEVEELLSEDGDEEDLGLHHDENHDYFAPRMEGRRRRSAGGSVLGFMMGTLFAVAGIGLGAAPMFGLEHLSRPLGELGIEPGTFVVVGLVLVFLSGMRGHVRGGASRMADLEQAFAHQTAELQHSVDYLVEQQRLHGELPPASGEELDRVLVVMQRLDEKINNLTKAFKMYGKPLVEISNQSTDIAAEVTDLRTLVEGVLESVSRGFRRSEESLKSMTEDGALQEQIRAMVEQARQARSEGGALHEQLRATVDRVQKATHEGFDRMRQELKTLADRVAENRALGFGLEKLEARMDETAARVLQGLQKAGSAGGEGMADLEGPIREIQREVATLATTMASLQHKIGSGGGGYQAAPRAAPAPAFDSASAPAPPPSSGGSSIGGGVLAHSISGTRKAGGKNVLGAIAKLRQMRN